MLHLVAVNHKRSGVGTAVEPYLQDSRYKVVLYNGSSALSRFHKRSDLGGYALKDARRRPARI